MQSQMDGTQDPIHSGDAVPAFTFEQWLDRDEFFDTNNYGSLRLSTFRALDKRLWTAETIRSGDRQVLSCYLDLEDVAVLRDAGQVTNQAEWDALVEERYRAAYQEALDRHHERRQTISWLI